MKTEHQCNKCKLVFPISQFSVYRTYKAFNGKIYPYRSKCNSCRIVERQCKDCQEILPIDQFPKSGKREFPNGNVVFYRRHTCSACHNAYYAEDFRRRALKSREAMGEKRREILNQRAQSLRNKRNAADVCRQCGKDKPQGVTTCYACYYVHWMSDTMLRLRKKGLCHIYPHLEDDFAHALTPAGRIEILTQAGVQQYPQFKLARFQEVCTRPDLAFKLDNIHWKRNKLFKLNTVRWGCNTLFDGNAAINSSGDSRRLQENWNKISERNSNAVV